MSEAATKPHAFKNGSRTFLTQVGIFSTKQNGLKYFFFSINLKDICLKIKFETYFSILMLCYSWSISIEYLTNPRVRIKVTRLFNIDINYVAVSFY